MENEIVLKINRDEIYFSCKGYSEEFEIVEISEHSLQLNVFDNEGGEKLKNFVVIDIQNQCIFSLSGWQKK